MNREQLVEISIAALIACVLALILPEAWADTSQVQVVEQVYTTDLKSVGYSHEGSIPSLDTNISKWWVTLPLTSWHKEDKDYNERNWGIGLEHKQTESWSWVGGTYRNSFYEQSYYAGGVWTPLKFEIQEVTIKGGFLLGFFSGYENKVMFLTPPVIQIEAFKKWGGDFLIGDGFVGFSFKFNKGILE